MKKRLSMTMLLVVAMVSASVLPVSASAPVFYDDLPRVILTTGGPNAVSPQVLDMDQFLYFYDGIGMNMAVYQTTPFPENRFRVYLYDSTDGGAGASQILPTMLGGTGGPTVARNLTDLEYAQLSAADDEIQGLAATSIYTSWTADMDRHWLSLENGGPNASYAMKFVALVTNTHVDGDAAKVAEKDFEVYVDTGVATDTVQFWWAYSPDGYTGPNDGVADIGPWSHTMDNFEANLGNELTFDIVNGRPSMDCATGTSLDPWESIDFGPMLIQDEADVQFFIPHDGGGLADPVFQAKVTLSTDGTPGVFAEAPGYRLGFQNRVSTHVGYFVVDNTRVNSTGTYAMPENAPYGLVDSATNSFVARLYWTTPYDASDMADNGGIAQFANWDVSFNFPGETAGELLNFNDGRDYTLTLDVIDRSGDSGILYIDSIFIRTFEESTDLVAGDSVEWTSASVPNISDPAAVVLPLFAGVFEPGFSALTAGAIRDGMMMNIDYGAGASPQFAIRLYAESYVTGWIGGIGEFRAYSAYPARMLDGLGGGAGVLFPQYDRGLQYNMGVVADSLVRCTLETKAQDIGVNDEGRAPVLRLQLSANAVDSGNDWGDHWRGIMWEEVWGSAVPSPLYKAPSMRDRDPTLYGAGNTERRNPGVPAATGSTLKSYMWTHEAAAGGADDFIQPGLAVFSLGLYGLEGLTDGIIWVNTDIWPDENGGIDFYSVMLEEMDVVAGLAPLN